MNFPCYINNTVFQWKKKTVLAQPSFTNCTICSMTIQWANLHDYKNPASIPFLALSDYSTDHLNGIMQYVLSLINSYLHLKNQIITPRFVHNTLISFPMYVHILMYFALSVTLPLQSYKLCSKYNKKNLMNGLNHIKLFFFTSFSHFLSEC